MRAHERTHMITISCPPLPGILRGWGVFSGFGSVWNCRLATQGAGRMWRSPSWLWGVPLQALPRRQQREKNEGAVPCGGILKWEVGGEKWGFRFRGQVTAADSIVLSLGFPSVLLKCWVNTGLCPFLFSERRQIWELCVIAALRSSVWLHLWLVLYLQGEQFVWVFKGRGLL